MKIIRKNTNKKYFEVTICDLKSGGASGKEDSHKIMGYELKLVSAIIIRQ